jgi:hypothetical protein
MPISKASSNAVAAAAKGDLVVGNATNDSGVLAVGSTDQVLTVDSSTATGLKWATASAGGMTLISETVASALTSLSFTSLGNYKQLLLIWRGIQHSTTSTEFNIRLNNDSASNYTVTQMYSSNAVNGFLRSSYTSITGDNVPAFGYDANSSDLARQAGGWILIDNYTSTSKFKSISGQWSYTEASGVTMAAFQHQGVYRSTSAVTSIDIYRGSGTATFSNTSNTTIRLYGLS